MKVFGFFCALLIAPCFLVAPAYSQPWAPTNEETEYTEADYAYGSDAYVPAAQGGTETASGGGSSAPVDDSETEEVTYRILYAYHIDYLGEDKCGDACLFGYLEGESSGTCYYALGAEQEVTADECRNLCGVNRRTTPQQFIPSCPELVNVNSVGD